MALRGCPGKQDGDEDPQIQAWNERTRGDLLSTPTLSLTVCANIAEKKTRNGQVKRMWIEELELDCGTEDIRGLIDGYGVFCDKLSDITLNRKGYHVCFKDERTMEIQMLKRENAKLKGRLGADGAASAAGDNEEV